MMPKVSYEVLDQVDFDSEVPASAYAEFINGPLWDDFKAVIMGQVARAQHELNGCDDTTEMFRLQGKIAALNDVLTLPEVIYETIKQEQEERQRNAEAE